MAKSTLVMAPMPGTIFQVPSGAGPIGVFDENGGALKSLAVTG